MIYAVLAGLTCMTAALLIQMRRKSRELERLRGRTGSLEQQASILHTIYTSIPDLVFSKDCNSVYTSCNPSFEKFAGCTEHELVGKTDGEIFHIDPEMAKLFIEADQKVIGGEKIEIIEETITYPDGTRRLVETKKTPLYQGKVVIGMMGISRDITERKAAELAKSQFLAHMSHEIRTPLNAIIGFSQMVKRSIDDRAKSMDFMDKIILSSHHLMDILNDILDLSKIESGKMELFCEPFCLHNTCLEIDDMIQQQCAQKNLRYASTLDTCCDQVVVGDKLRLTQVIINLLSNAIKFTAPDGEVRFEVRCEEETDEALRLSFHVRDTGIGMKEEQLQRLFTAFDQTDRSISTKFGGTGLGLSISQSLIELMGGVIQVDSVPGEGSHFYFGLALQKGELPEVQEEPEISQLDLSGKRILLAEDIETNRLVLAAMLADTHVELVEAWDGKQAVERFADSPEGYYDLILMDVQMPHMDGYEATRAIRSLPHPQAQAIPIVAMTANSYKEDVDKALASGMNEHMAKPVEYAKLLLLLDRLLGIQRAVSGHPAP